MNELECRQLSLGSFGAHSMVSATVSNSIARAAAVIGATWAALVLPAPIFPAQANSQPEPIVAFTVYSLALGREPWVTDGTRQGTRMLRDIVPGWGESFPSTFTWVGDGRFTFIATDGVTGHELWISDGTADGTHLLRDIQNGAGSSQPSKLYPLGNGQFLFSADDGLRGRELWTTDLTRQGTRPLKNIRSAEQGSDPQLFTALGTGRYVFSAHDGINGVEPWVTDGTRAGTRLLRDLNPGSDSSNPAEFTDLGNGHMVFNANVNQIWITDGTRKGTKLIRQLPFIIPKPGIPTSTSPVGFVSLDLGRAMFAADDGEHGLEPWITDGTTAGTRMVRDITKGLKGSKILSL